MVNKQYDTFIEQIWASFQVCFDNDHCKQVMKNDNRMTNVLRSVDVIFFHFNLSCYTNTKPCNYADVSLCS